MNKELIKKFNNEDLLKEICEAYNYSVKITNDKVICIIDGGDENDCDTYKYNTIEEALVDWLDTLLESEMEYVKDGVNISWEMEIEYIKEIRDKMFFNEASTSLDKALTYGKIPNNLYKRLSLFVEKQSDLVDRYIKQMNSFNKPNSFKLIDISLPVEFILVDDKLEYIKIANTDFLKRLIFNSDTSEIEDLEQDTYSKKGLVKFMPLLPINKVTKFELNIPVAVSIKPNNIEINTPVKYLYLF